MCRTAAKRTSRSRGLRYGLLAQLGFRMKAQHEITGLLLEYRSGDRESLDQLLPLVYDELRHIAHRELRRERRDHTLSTTEIVHEAYLKLVDQTRATAHDRVRFYAVAATAMRRILITYARRRQTQKRGGGQQMLSLDDGVIAADDRTEALLALDAALTRLSALNERLVRVVECRFFGGLTEEETAEALDTSARTVRRDWVKARAWLYTQLQEQAT